MFSESSVPSRSKPDKKPKRSAARAPGTWSRARRWINKLLGRPVEPAAKRAPAKRASTLDKAEVERVRQDLSDVLDQHPQARKVLRFVCALEHALEKKGRFALDDLPVDVIRRALEQLDPLVTDWTPEGLSTLRSKAAMAVANRERLATQQAEARQARLHSDEDDVDVEEASVTTFMQANEEWERSFTGNTDRAPLDETPMPAVPKTVD